MIITIITQVNKYIEQGLVVVAEQLGNIESQFIQIEVYCPAMALVRLKIQVTGQVQGVGFRPIAYRYAQELAVVGWIQNTPDGVELEVEGQQAYVFLQRLQQSPPPNSKILSLKVEEIPLAGGSGFTIITSRSGGKVRPSVPPDLATCPDCLIEIQTPHNIRFQYPFTNCINCGPRYSILNSMPYDRANTAMKTFSMCRGCLLEYNDPNNRRFHAQPNACPQCGPQLELWNQRGTVLSTHHQAMIETCSQLTDGKVVAIKGLGGFHLCVDATQEQAIKTLRHRKHRDAKPLALMFPCLEAVLDFCHADSLEISALASNAAPIVLLKLKHPSCWPYYLPINVIAPNLSILGVMLPYTPLHHILTKIFNRPLIATSANLSDEPICYTNQQALTRLSAIADYYLVHNRPIVRPIDDSIVRKMAETIVMLRRARGYVPSTISLHTSVPNVLALGPHMKNTIAFFVGNNLVLSEHQGDLSTLESQQRYRNTVTDLPRLYNTHITQHVCDLHPQYFTTQYAYQQSTPYQQTQHHYAHALACMAEHAIPVPFLAATWDGTGYGTDKTIWGGEFLAIDHHTFTRVCTLTSLQLPGGEIAIHEIWRLALSLLYKTYGPQFLSFVEKLNLFCDIPTIRINNVCQMIIKNTNCIPTTSMGRLFDGIAALIGITSSVAYEGQAAMLLENIASEEDNVQSYPYEYLAASDPLQPNVLDWRPIIQGIIEDLQDKVALSTISTRFHVTLADITAYVARNSGMSRVALTGGCFQNKQLLERSKLVLLARGFDVYFHQALPANDGSIALGQLISASIPRGHAV